MRRALIEFPEELNNPEPSVGCHLHRACREGKLSVVQTMVELGADINIKDSRDRIAPIAEAAGDARLEIVAYLLSLGCELDISTSLANPLFSCIASSLYRNALFAQAAGYKNVNEVRERLSEIAKLLIQDGIDLTACYNQQSMVNMDASAFAYMFGLRDIAEAVISSLYGHDERLAASARAEAIEVAVGNAFSRQKFRRWRYPPRRGKNAGWTPLPGEYWVKTNL